MRRAMFAIGLVAFCLWTAGDASGRGGRGGGGGGMRGGGGGGMRGGGGGGYRGGGYSGSRTPSMSRPASRPTSVSRPSTRPSTRPSYGNMPTPGRPGGGASRPAGSRPGNLPSIAQGGGARPGTLPAGGRPSRSDLNNFLDIGSGNASGARPSTLPSRGALAAGGPAAEFLQSQPGQLPSGPGNRVDVGRPGRPDVGQPGRPDIGQPGRPDLGQPGRPDIGQPGRPDIGQTGRPDIGQPGRPDLGRPGTPGRNYVQNLPSRIANRDQWQNWRQANRGDIWNYWQNNHGYFDDWFDGNWWNNGIADDIPYGRDFGYWGWAAWGGLTGWVNYGWTDPIYYNYGENVYYDNGSVYYGDQAVCSEAEYAAQAEAIATSTPETPPAKEDWMPLGVFAMTTDGEPTGALPTMFLQLAVSKQGVISGTFQNTATGSAQLIEGMVDKQTQRAAWTAEGKARPLMETGIGNLTQDTTPVLVHFADGSTQQWLLVRLEKPEAAAAATPAAPATPGTAPATPLPTPPNPDAK